MKSNPNSTSSRRTISQTTATLQQEEKEEKKKKNCLESTNNATQRPESKASIPNRSAMTHRLNIRFIRMTQFRPEEPLTAERRRRRLVVPRLDSGRSSAHTRYQALRPRPCHHATTPPPPLAHVHVRRQSYRRGPWYACVRARFDRTRCLQGAVAWLGCRVGRQRVAKIGRKEGLWIDIVTGVSSGFLGGATERVSRQTLRPMYQPTQAGTQFAFAGTYDRRWSVSQYAEKRRPPVVVESRAWCALSNRRIGITFVSSVYSDQERVKTKKKRKKRKKKKRSRRTETREISTVHVADPRRALSRLEESRFRFTLVDEENTRRAGWLDEPRTRTPGQLFDVSKLLIFVFLIYFRARRSNAGTRRKE